MSRVDPESMGLNPAWRNSLVYVGLGTGWKDGASSTEIEAARQLLIQDMKTLEGIAPDSGAYLNEVRATPRSTMAIQLGSFLLIHVLLRVGFEIRIRLEEVLLRRPLR